MVSWAFVRHQLTQGKLWNRERWRLPWTCRMVAERMHGGIPFNDRRWWRRVWR